MRIKIKTYSALIAILCLAFFSETAAQIGLDIMSRKSSLGAYDSLAIEGSKKSTGLSTGLLEKEINPKEYTLGPSDVIDILILTSRPMYFSVAISPQGRLLIPNVGMVDLKNKTLAEGEILIKQAIKRTYNLDDIYIDLKEIRNFKVSVVGNVLKTGSFPASAVARVSEIIENAGGLESEASWRKIKILREGFEDPIPVDLIRFFMLNDKNSNPFVNGGDQIIVPPKNKHHTIEIAGEVAFPGEFEYVEGDSLSTLIKFAIGYLESAFLDSVEIARFELKSDYAQSFFVDLSSWPEDLYSSNYLKNDIPLQPGDKVFIRRKANWYNTKTVKITGEVRYPGVYAILRKDMRLSDLVSMAGGLTENASLGNSELTRVSQQYEMNRELGRLANMPPNDMSEQEKRYYRAHLREKRGMMSIDFKKALIQKDTVENIILRDKDSLNIAPKLFFVNVQGIVKNPGLVPYQPGLLYMDYIRLAGGFGYRADNSEILIEKQQGQIFHAESEKYILQPGDKIIVPPKPEKDLLLTGLTIATQIFTILGVIIALINMR